MHLSVWFLARAGWTCLPLCHNGEALGTGRHVTRTQKVHEDTDIPADVSTNQPLYSQKPNKKIAHRTQSPLKTGRNLTRMTSSRKVHPVQELTLQSLVPPGPLCSGESRAHTHVCAHAPLHTLLLRKNSPGHLADSDLDIIWNIPDFYTFLLETRRCKPPLEDSGVVPCPSRPNWIESACKASNNFVHKWNSVYTAQGIQRMVTHFLKTFKTVNLLMGFGDFTYNPSPILHGYLVTV